MYNTITEDPHPPNPAAPWFVRTSDGYEWHTATRESAEQELNGHLAGRNLKTAETALLDALTGYVAFLPGCTEDVRNASHRRVRGAVGSLPHACIPTVAWTGPPSYIA